MADEQDGDAAALDAEALRGGGLRQRMGRARFRELVREGLEAELSTRVSKPAGVKKYGYRKAEVPAMMQVVTDDDIDSAADRLAGSSGQSVPDDPAAEGGAEGGAEAKGPIRDWFAANPELVQAVIAALLKAIFGI